MKRFLLAGITLGFTFWGGHSAYALNAQLFRPQSRPDQSVTLFGTSTLKKQQWEAALFFNWVQNPLEFGRLSSDGRVDDVVNWFFSSDLLFSFGLHDQVTLKLDLPIHWVNDVENILQVSDNRKIGLGDLRFSSIFQLRSVRNAEGKAQWGFGLVPFITAPTGDSSDFVGDKNLTAGFHFTADRYLTRRNYLAFNLGFRFRQKEEILNLSVGHEMTGSVGYVCKLSIRHEIDLFLEFFGSTTFEHFLSQEVTTPIEFLGGFRKRWWKNRLGLAIGAGRGITNGYGAPDVRVFAGLSYQAPRTPKPAPEEPPPVEEEPPPPPPPTELEKVAGDKIELSGKILFDLNQASIKAASHSILDHVTEVLKAHPEITQVRIEAHTDSQGSDTYNLTLSERRAKSVFDYLVKHGISSERLSSQGFGETQPVDTNETKEGRAKNRRVEFVIGEIQAPKATP